jgi:hypothetical protein
MSKLPPDWEAEAARGRAIAAAAGVDLPAFQIRYDWPQWDPDSEPPGKLLYLEGTVELLGAEDAVNALDGGGARVIGGIDRDGIRWKGPLLGDGRRSSELADCLEYRVHGLVRVARAKPFRAAQSARHRVLAQGRSADPRGTPDGRRRRAASAEGLGMTTEP